MNLFRTKRVTSPEDGRVHFDRLYIVDLPGFGVLLHRLRAPDHDRDLHDHPWSFWSFVLWGGYEEVVPKKVNYRWTLPKVAWPSRRRMAVFPPLPCETRLIRWFNRKRAAVDDPHRISFVAPHTWTLCFRGPKRRDWGFHTEHGWVDKRDYLGER